MDAIWQVNIPTAFVVIDPHSNFANRWWMIFPIPQNDEIRTELSN